MEMVLDSIIEMELEFLKKNRVPTRVFLSLNNFKALVQELEANSYLHSIHNMRIEIVKSEQILVL